MKQKRTGLIPRLTRLIAVLGLTAAAALSSAGEIFQWGDSFSSPGKPTDGGYVQVAAGEVHSVALKADGSIVQWGDNSYFQLNGKPTDAGYVQVAAGGLHSVALKADGSIVQWGNNSYSQLNGKPTDAGYVQVAAGAYHSVALKADGTIVQWGDNSYSQLYGKPTDAGYVQVAAGTHHSVGLKADGSIVQWGNNYYSQLNGKPTDAGYVQVAAGFSHSVALQKPKRSWAVTRLHPAGALSSGANAVDGPKQGGYADYGTGPRATTWYGTNAPNDLGPGVVNGLDGGREYGDYGDRIPTAVSWNGTEASITALLIPDIGMGLADSHCSDAADGQQVGWGFDTIDSNVCMLWTGPVQPASIIVWGGLNAVQGVGGGQQVGHTVQPYAALWTGTHPFTGIDLHPVGATFSAAFGTDGLQQVGWANFGGVEMAGFWTGSKHTWTSLHPAGATRSSARRVSEGMQVGHAVVGGVQRASFWEGSAGSWVDLGASLPPEFAGMESTAKDIYVVGNTVTIVGDAINGLTGQREAIMWVSSGGAVDTAIDSNYDRFGKSISNYGTTLSPNLYLTLSGSAAAGVEGFQYSVDGGPFKHCGKAIWLPSMAVGTHTIEVRAVDASASVDLTPATLTWTVTTPSDVIGELQDYVQNQGFINQVKFQLLPLLNQILAKIESGNISQAITLLNTFKTKVNSLLSQGKLTSQQAQYLTHQANAVIASLQ